MRDGFSILVTFLFFGFAALESAIAAEPKEKLVSVLSKEAPRCVRHASLCSWVRSEIRKSSDLETERSIIHRAAPLTQYYRSELRRHGLPAYYAIIPHIESRNNPLAVSPRGAVGVWQIMPDTARDLEMSIRGRDSRKNIVKSTQKIVLYLDRLHKRYDGDVVSVLAAYNWGPARVDNVLKINAGLISKKDLPPETLGYILNFFKSWTAIKTNKIDDLLSRLPNVSYLEIVKNPKHYSSVNPHDQNLIRMLNYSRGSGYHWLIPNDNFFRHYSGTYIYIK